LLVTVGAAASSGYHGCLFEMQVFVDDDAISRDARGAENVKISRWP